MIRFLDSNKILSFYNLNHSYFTSVPHPFANFQEILFDTAKLYHKLEDVLLYFRIYNQRLNFNLSSFLIDKCKI